MTTVIHLKFSQRADSLNKFDHGYLVVAKDSITTYEWYNYRGGKPGGSSISKHAYVHFVDSHYVITDLNDKPIAIFHEFEEIIKWADDQFNPDPKRNSYLCQLPAHKRKDAINHYYEIIGLQPPQKYHTPLETFTK